MAFNVSCMLLNKLNVFAVVPCAANAVSVFIRLVGGAELHPFDASKQAAVASLLASALAETSYNATYITVVVLSEHQGPQHRRQLLQASLIESAASVTIETESDRLGRARGGEMSQSKTITKASSAAVAPSAVPENFWEVLLQAVMVPAGSMTNTALEAKVKAAGFQTALSALLGRSSFLVSEGTCILVATLS